jgi:hypothetical protein
MFVKDFLFEFFFCSSFSSPQHNTTLLILSRNFHRTMTAVYQQVQQQNASLLTLSNAINLLSPNPSVIVQVEGANSLYTSPHIIHSSSFSKQPQQNLVSDLANHRLHSPSAIPSTPSVGLKTSLEVSNLLPSPVASSSATTSSSFRFPYRTFNPKSSLEIVSRLEAVHQRETQLLQQLKQHLHQSEPLTLPSTASNFSVQLLSQELHALLEEKNQVLASLCSIPFQSGVEKYAFLWFPSSYLRILSSQSAQILSIFEENLN